MKPPEIKGGTLGKAVIVYYIVVVCSTHSDSQTLRAFHLSSEVRELILFR